MMDHEIKSKRLLLLIDLPSAGQIDPSTWLKDRGYTTWRANDFSHALEELSDFTVRNRPDVIVLEASPMSECIEALRETFCLSDREADVAVVGISGEKARYPSDRFLAHDLDQLERLIFREAGHLPC